MCMDFGIDNWCSKNRISGLYFQHLHISYFIHVRCRLSYAHFEGNRQLYNYLLITITYLVTISGLLVRTIDTKGSLNFALPLDKDFSLFLCGWIVFVFETWFWQKEEIKYKKFSIYCANKDHFKIWSFYCSKTREESLDFAEQIHTTKKHINHKKQTSRFN